jgi:hypothetical protein
MLQSRSAARETLALAQYFGQIATTLAYTMETKQAQVLLQEKRPLLPAAPKATVRRTIQLADAPGVGLGLAAAHRSRQDPSIEPSKQKVEILNTITTLKYKNILYWQY